MEPETPATESGGDGPARQPAKEVDRTTNLSAAVFEHLYSRIAVDHALVLLFMMLEPLCVCAFLPFRSFDREGILALACTCRIFHLGLHSEAQDAKLSTALVECRALCQCCCRAHHTTAWPGFEPRAC